MSSLAIEDFCLRLDGLFAAGGDRHKVAAALAEYVENHDDWQRFARFAPDRYLRNLVRCTKDYELLVLCWQPGQASTIHNHAGSDCWMAVIEGPVQETQFHASHQATPGAPKAKDPRVFKTGEVAYISDDIALHRIEPVGEARGITLHLYSPPIRACSCYCPETGRVTERQLAYDSVGGEDAH